MSAITRVFSKLTGKTPFCSVVIVAAGSSTRMQGENKIFSELCGIPVIVRTVSAFEASSIVSEIIIVTKSDDIVSVANLCAEHNMNKVTHIIAGGETRMQSVSNGLNAISKKAEYVMIHDGARPLVTQKIIAEAFAAAEHTGAAAPAIEVTDTIKQIENGAVKGTLRRDTLIHVQTPQVFNVGLIKPAIQNALEKNLEATDDCMAVEYLGATVLTSAGSRENIKITTPEDIIFAEAIIDTREAKR